MPRLSAGLLMYRIKDGATEVLLAHPDGPYFVNKDDGEWSIPKGEPDADEDLLRGCYNVGIGENPSHGDE